VKEEQFDSIIDSYPDAIREIAIALRGKIFDLFPKVVEVVWVKQKIAGYGTGPKKNTEHFCWIQLAKSHVNLGFNYGTEIDDPNKILEGTGKKFRHIKIKSKELIHKKEVVDMIVQASTHKVPPFA